MSTVRMCDKCNTIFSENEDGWQTFTAEQIKFDPETGERKAVKMFLDACPSCALQPHRQFQRELQAAQEGRDLDARIAKLERETGVGQPNG